MEFDWSSRSEADVRTFGFILHDFITQAASRMTHDEWGYQFGEITTRQPLFISKRTNINLEHVELFLCELEAKEAIKAN